MKGVNIYGSTSYQVHEDRAGDYVLWRDGGVCNASVKFKISWEILFKRDQRVFSVYACGIRGFRGIWDIDHQAAP